MHDEQFLPSFKQDNVRELGFDRPESNCLFFPWPGQSPVSMLGRLDGVGRARGQLLRIGVERLDDFGDSALQLRIAAF